MSSRRTALTPSAGLGPQAGPATVHRLVWREDATPVQTALPASRQDATQVRGGPGKGRGARPREGAVSAGLAGAAEAAPDGRARSSRCPRCSRYCVTSGMSSGGHHAGRGRRPPSPPRVQAAWSGQEGKAAGKQGFGQRGSAALTATARGLSCTKGRVLSVSVLSGPETPPRRRK